MLLNGSKISQLEALKRSLKSPWILSSFFTYSHGPSTRSKEAPLQETRMRDRTRLHARGGDGGSGCTSFRRSRHNRHGKPDGGDGGRGGDVILECSKSVWDFRGLRPHVNGGKGGHGASKNMIGTRGKDQVVMVPVGTVIHLLKGDMPSVDVDENYSTKELDPWDLPGSLDNQQLKYHLHSDFKILNMTDQSESIQSGDERSLESEAIFSTQSTLVVSKGEQVELLQNGNCRPLNSEEITGNQSIQDESQGVEFIQNSVAELTKQGQRIVVAHGGEGGLGNISLIVSKKTKPGDVAVIRDDMLHPEAPKVDQSSLSTGLPGSEAILMLELKSIADVGLVGMPNAGKSTLLGAISRAKPAVGHYAFTTLRPNLGKVNFDDFSITVADIPGLIKGAHENRGLGHAFLRHIERTKVLVYVVDLASGTDGRKGSPPWEQLRDLVLELEHHQQGLSDRPYLVVANKIDETGAEAAYEELKRKVEGVPIYPVCAVLGEGVSELKVGLRMLVDDEIPQRLSLDKIECS